MSIFAKIAAVVFSTKENDVKMITDAVDGKSRTIPKSLTAAELKARNEGETTPVILNDVLGQHKSTQGIPSRSTPFDKVPQTFENNWEKNNPQPTEEELQAFTKWLKVEIGLMAASKRDRWEVRYDIERRKIKNGPLFFNVTISQIKRDTLSLSIKSAPIIQNLDSLISWTGKPDTYETTSANATDAKPLLNNAVVKACRDWGWHTPHRTIEERDADNAKLGLLYGCNYEHLEYDIEIRLYPAEPQVPEVPQKTKPYWSY